MADADTTQGDAPAAGSAPSGAAPTQQTPPQATPPQSDAESTDGPLNPPQAGTTRDGNDSGVRAVPTSGDEPTGPEDALGHGPKRGDYRDRQPEGAVHMRGVPIPEDELQRDDDGNVIDGQPLTRLEVQNQHVENIGDVPGKKGGVHTHLDDTPEHAHA